MPNLNPNNSASGSPPARSSNSRRTRRSTRSNHALCVFGLSVLVLLQILAFAYFAPTFLHQAPSSHFSIKTFPKGKDNIVPETSWASALLNSFGFASSSDSVDPPTTSVLVLILCTLCSCALGLERAWHILAEDMRTPFSATSKNTLCNKFVNALFLGFFVTLPVLILSCATSAGSYFHGMELIFIVLCWMPLSIYMFLLFFFANPHTNSTKDIEALHEPDNRDPKEPYGGSII